MRASPAASQFVLVFTFAATVAVSLVLTVLLGRALAPDDFGLFALVVALFAFAREAIDLGTSATASRDMGRDPASERHLLEGLYYVRRIVAFVLAALAVGLAFMQHDPVRQAVILGAAAALAMLGPTAYHASFQARQALIAPSAAALLTQLLLLGACVLLIARGITGPQAAGLVVAREVVLVVAIAILGRRLVGFRARPRPHFDTIRAFYAAAGIWAVAALCRHLFVQADVLAIYLARGNGELGAWAAAYRILAPVLALPWIVVIPLVPVLAAEERSRSGSALLASIWSLGLGVGLLVAACTLVAAPDLVAILYGGRYLQPPLDAVPAMRWIAFALAPAFITEIAAAGLLANGRVRWVLATSAAGLAFKIVANAILVPRYGFVAAAATTALVEVSASVALCMALPLRWRALAASCVVAALPAVAALALAVGAMAWIESPALRLASVVAIGVAGLAALLRSTTGRDYFRRLRDARNAFAAPGEGSAMPAGGAI